MKRICIVLVAWILAAAPAPAASVYVCPIKLEAGKQDRKNEPVCVLLELPSTLAQARLAEVHGSQGAVLPGQLTDPGLLAEQKTAPEGKVARELHFILPQLKAGETVTFMVNIHSLQNPAAGTPLFSWHDTPGQYTELTFGTQPVLRYLYKAFDPEKREETMKPYHHLYDPDGKRLLTKGPGGLYTHHRGIFFGFKSCKYEGHDVDVWHCVKDKDGKQDSFQSHEKFLAEEAGPVLGRQRVEIAWHGYKQEVFAIEERELTVYYVPGGELVEFASVVRPTRGPVQLGGDPQHSGFHFRADDEVAKKTKDQTYFFNPNGATKHGVERNWPQDKTQVNLPWNAMSFVLGDTRYTAAYLDRPQNPKESRYSERTYGRFGSYFEVKVDKDHPLKVDYRLWVQKGEMTPEQVAALDAQLVDPAKAMMRK